jgi:hypothetical protein
MSSDSIRRLAKFIGDQAAQSQTTSAVVVSQEAQRGTDAALAGHLTAPDPHAQYVLKTRTITINGVAHDLSADPSWTVTADSVAWDDVTGTPATFPPEAHTQAAATITDLSEAVQDIVGAAVKAGGSNVTVTYNDTTGETLIVVSLQAHASSHASGGSDPITPASIGAAATGSNAADNRVAVWESGAVVGGDAGLTWDGAALASTGTITAAGDMFPTSAGAGIMARLANAGIAPYEHFRSGSMPAGFGWAGAPFTTPSSTTWSRNGDYLYLTPTSGGRHFLYRSVTSYLGRLGYIRAWPTFGSGSIGLRVDDGTDNNYYLLWWKNITIGYWTPQVQQRTGGGAITTITGPEVVRGNILPLLLFSNNTSGATHAPFPYVAGEGGVSLSLTSSGTGVTWVAARFGIIIEDAAASPGQVLCDWLHWTYT